MVSILGAVALGYLAATGVVTNAAVVGRGLFQAARRTAHGEFGEAAVDVLAAFAAPTVMAFAATTALVMDVIEAAQELAEPAVAEVDSSLQRRAA